MSSAAFAQARAFYLKANELEDKGHLLRAAENYSRAAEAARALAPGPDNVVALDMQRSQAHVLLSHALAVDNSTAEARLVVTSHRAESVALLSTVVAAVERRRMAGTLLEGRCTAAEETWDAAMVTDAGLSADEVACCAKLVGYYTFLRAAFSSLVLLDNAWFFDEECSATQFEAFTQVVVHATDLIQLPRSHAATAMAAEVYFAERLSSDASDASGVPYLQNRGLDPRLVQLLTDAWQRLQQSGVLETRCILNERNRLEHSTYHEKGVAAIDAAMAAPGLRSCALAGCGAKEAHPQHFKRCSACKGVVYCGKEHQLEAWPSHKKACKAACKAAAAASEGGAGPGAAS